MKFSLTLLAILLAAACTQEAPVQDPNPRDVSYVDMPTGELATIDETCTIADTVVSSFVTWPAMQHLQEARNTLHENLNADLLPAWFWEPLLMRVYAEPLETLGIGEHIETAERRRIVARFRNKLTLECHASGRRLSRQHVTAYYQTKAAEAERANLN